MRSLGAWDFSVGGEHRLLPSLEAQNRALINPSISANLKEPWIGPVMFFGIINFGTPIILLPIKRNFMFFRHHYRMLRRHWLRRGLASQVGRIGSRRGHFVRLLLRLMLLLPSADANGFTVSRTCELVP